MCPEQNVTHVSGRSLGIPTVSHRRAVTTIRTYRSVGAVLVPSRAAFRARQCVCEAVLQGGSGRARRAGCAGSPIRPVPGPRSPGSPVPGEETQKYVAARGGRGVVSALSRGPSKAPLPARRRPVTEIFRSENGAWVY